MTEQTTVTATVTVLEQRTELRVIGAPDLRNQHGGGHLRPIEVTLAHRPGGVRAQVYGHWVRGTGELTDAPLTANYAAHGDDLGDWPEWLAALARAHAPQTAAAGTTHAERISA